MASNAPKIFLDVQTPGGTTFKLSYFRGVERLSDLFEYTILMTAQNRDISFESLIGQSATVSVGVGNLTRTYNGIIGQFEQEDTPFKPLDMWTVYKAKLYPKLWLLTFSGQCRIFQNKSTVDIITSVLQENEIPFKNKITTAGMQPREYCVQYNETNFNFICRLMEEEGIYYFFQQDQTGHMLILADSIEAHAPCPNAATASFHDSAPDDQFMLKVSSCFIKQRIVPQSDTLKSYNYITPQTALKSTSEGSMKAGGGNITSYYERFEKQGRGDELVKVRIQSQEFPQKSVEGVSTIPFFLSGYKFTLESHPRADANLEYVLYEVIHEARSASKSNKAPLYKNTYRAFPSTVSFKPAQITHKPRIYSTQTAKVTGKENEEIYTEEYGRIKVKFHWDPSEKNDESTSCWIRVATLWAGQTWGTLFTPRIGHEVVVSFIDGDPDKPLVVGSVYNGDNKPPYLPSEPTKSTIKSQTSKKGEAPTPGFNEFRFEDKKFFEEIYIHAQKDFKIDIQNNHDITIVGGNRTILLEAMPEDQEERAGETSNDSLTLNNGDKSLKIIRGNYTVLLDEGNITVTCAAGNVDFDVNGNISFKCTGNFSVDAAQNISLIAGESITAEAGIDISMTAGAEFSAEAGADASITAGVAVTAEAGVDISLTAGGVIDAQAVGDISLSAVGAVTAEAVADISLTAGGIIDAQAGLDISLTAIGVFDAQAGLDASITGIGTVTIEGLTVEIIALG